MFLSEICEVCFGVLVVLLCFGLDVVSNLCLLAPIEGCLLGCCILFGYSEGSS